ncbi:polysaccharide deacetylase family protein [Dissulfurirhabdus thermomarina]|uniref:Polysaccharide deacetylase family protein n=1 Tax=Dissulfurirhabdus thermomarina TaxID=1765737 RepID=A0A6N9TPK9_DISTH|nr:polysaccharide deacetylase family protein [Dissulfurirhabdus thermomarina]NDY41674.1 polysaccharide deacetylase family protein [Dissulfurirhabdus thermomarina]NMX22758.1 polysaccharide deacetylase family protein [Dissulfurirhabdus thermomarina]
MDPRLLGIAAAGVGAGVAGGLLYQVFSMRATLGGRVITHGPRNRPAVALVFDRSPSRHTEALCTRLHELAAPAAFFLEGRRILAHPAAMKALRGFEIGVQGASQAPLIFRRRRTLRRLLGPVVHRVAETLRRPPRFLMPPRGWKDWRLCEEARGMGLVVLNPSLRVTTPADASARGLRRVRPGDILALAGDGADGTRMEHLLETLVTGLRHRGLEIWGLNALLARDY